MFDPDVRAEGAEPVVKAFVAAGDVSRVDHARLAARGESGHDHGGPAAQIRSGKRFAAISRVFAKLPYVEEVSLERQLPNKVIITVQECKALAYIAVGDENWTIDRSCKVLGKATDDELGALIRVEGLDPGTLLIGERLTSADGSGEIIDFISDVLYQIQARNLAEHILSLDFSDPLGASMQYGTRFTVIIGGKSEVNHKFAMLESVLEQLKEGDGGVINVSDGSTAHFIPQ